MVDSRQTLLTDTAYRVMQSTAILVVVVVVFVIVVTTTTTTTTTTTVVVMMINPAFEVFILISCIC